MYIMNTYIEWVFTYIVLWVVIKLVCFLSTDYPRTVTYSRLDDSIDLILLLFAGYTAYIVLHPDMRLFNPCSLY